MPLERSNQQRLKNLVGKLLPSHKVLGLALALALTATLTYFSLFVEGHSDDDQSPHATEKSNLKGINVNPWFRKPNIIGTWDRHRTDAWKFGWPPFPIFNKNSYREDLTDLKKAGFNLLRVPIHVGPFMTMNRDQRRVALKNIGIVLDTALQLNFMLMVEYHTSEPGISDYKEISNTPENKSRYIAAMLDLVDVIGAKSPSKIIFETINEPSTSCNDDGWRQFQKEIVEAIIDAFPKTKIAVTGSCYSDVNSIILIRPEKYAVSPDNLFFTFHYYKPYTFTHQGNSWSGDPQQRYVTGLSWPAHEGTASFAHDEIRRTYRNSSDYKTYGENPLKDTLRLADKYYQIDADEEDIKADFAAVSSWAQDNDVSPSKIILGEFGVLRREGKWFGADMDSAARWIKTTREEAEKAGFAWAMWSYKEGFALAEDSKPASLNTNILKALGLIAEH